MIVVFVFSAGCRALFVGCAQGFTADARPRRPSITPAPEGRGMPAGEDTRRPARGGQDRGPDPRSGERT